MLGQFGFNPGPTLGQFGAKLGTIVAQFGVSGGEGGGGGGGGGFINLKSPLSHNGYGGRPTLGPRVAAPQAQGKEKGHL